MTDRDLLRLRFDQFELDEVNARLTRDGQPVVLAPKAFAVLCALARQSGQLVTKNALLDAVWGHQHVSESVLKTVVSELRAALDDDARQPRYIETASRRGYRFIAKTLSPTGQPSVVVGVTPTAAVERQSVLVPASPLVGRQAALARLRASWDQASAGRRQIFWVAGEAGVGKTTLIENFVAGLGPVSCAFGQCVEQHGAGEPYLPVLEALGTLCRNDPALVPMMRTIAPTWIMQMPWLSSEAERESLRESLAGANQDRMLREIGELLDRYTAQRPLLLVTEDLHWSDHATVRLIDHVARRRGPARFLWLASFRLAEVIAEDHPLKSLRHELRLHRLCEELVLDLFSEREVADYLECRFPDRAVSETFVHALHARTDGLPLFVVNVIDDLVAQDLLEAAVATDDVAVAGWQIPENLAGVIGKQLARLLPEDRAVLEAASVCGVEFRAGVVATALNLQPGEAAELCDALVRRRQWLTALPVERLADGQLDAHYGFQHALYRHVLYQSIGAHARMRLHARVAQALQGNRDQGVAVTAAELASHFELSHDPLTALRYYVEAASNALNRFAPTEALELTAHALHLAASVADGVERNGLELALLTHRGVAASQLLGVASPEAREAFERAQRLSDRLPPAPVRAAELSGQGWVYYTRGEYDAALAHAKRMLALAEVQRDPILRACAYNLLGTTAAYQGDIVNGARWLEQGLVECEQLGDGLAALVVDPVVSMRANLFVPLAHLGRPEQAVAQMTAAIARAEQIGQPMAQMLALWCTGIMQARLGQAEAVLQAGEALQTLIGKHGLAQAEGPARWLCGWAIAQRGEPERGHRLIMEGYERHARFEMYGGGTQVLGYAAEALIQGARWEDAHAQVDEALALAKRIGERVFIPDLQLLRARAALGRGRADTACDAMQAALQEARAQQALGQEIDALVALCELDRSGRADLDALADAYGRLTEGFDVPVVRRARRLLTLRQGAGAPGS